MKLVFLALVLTISSPDWAADLDANCAIPLESQPYCISKIKAELYCERWSLAAQPLAPFLACYEAYASMGNNLPIKKIASLCLDNNAVSDTDSENQSLCQ